MGEDAAAVTDPRLALRGVEGVRIADASVIPMTPVSALNAPSMLIGFRRALRPRVARVRAVSARE